MNKSSLETANNTHNELFQLSQLNEKLGQIIQSAFQKDKNVDDIKKSMILLIKQGADINNANVLENLFNKEGDHIPLLLEYAIELGADVNKIIDNENNRLIFLLKNKDLLKEKISNIEDINATNNAGMSLLHILCLQEDSDAQLIEMMIDNGANTTIEMNTGETPFKLAIINMNAQAVEMFIKKGTVVKTEDLFTAILKLEFFYSTLIEYSKSPRSVLDKVSVDEKERLGVNSFSSIIELLIDAKPDLKINNEYDETIFNSLMNAYNNIDDTYQENKTHFIFYDYDRLLKNIEIFAKRLIINGYDINTQDKYGQTVLFNVRSEKIAILLIEKGIDLTIKDNSGSTALFYIESEDVLQSLVEYGVDLNSKDNKNFTALSWSIFNNNLKKAQMLIDNGADTTLNTKTLQGVLVHNLYCMITSKEAGNFLLKNHVDLHEINNEGNNALMVLCTKEKISTEVVEFFIEQGLNLKIKNNDKKNILDLAKENNHLEVLQILRNEMKIFKNLYKFLFQKK